MTTTNTVDAARVELLLSELRLPTFKLMWAKLAEQSDKEGWPAARFLAALAEQRPVRDEEQGSVFVWGRLVWPVALAASLCLLLAGIFLFPWGSSRQTDLPQPHLAGSGVSIQLSYVVPTYTFRQEEIGRASCRERV